MNNNFLNCTKEVIYCLEKAKQLAILTNFEKDIYIIKPIHLSLSLIFNSKIIQKILNINISKLNKRIILNIIFNYINKNNIYKNLNNKYFYLDKNILILFNILNTLEYPFNTLILFYYLLKQNKKLYNYIFFILNIKNINYISFFIKYYINNNILIPSSLKEYISILKKKNNLIGREKELKIIIEILARKLNRNIILLGETGIGKLSIIRKLIYLMPNKIFLELNISNLILQYNNINLIKSLFNFLKKYNNIILYCKDFHLLFNNSIIDLSFLKNTIFELLSTNKIQIIATSTQNFYNKILKNEEKLKFLFSKITINELDKNILFLIIKQYLINNNIDWINDNIINNIIDLTKKYIKNYSFPQIGFLILDSIINKKYYNNKKNITKKDLITIIMQYSELSNIIMLKENNNIINIDINLKKCVFGQDIAITKITSSLKRAYTGLKDKNKPIGSWLLCGPSGTGKTELVKSLASLLFGSEKELIRFDMSEFMEKHSISKLIGSPPGYIGSDEGGLLTEAVKKKPYSIVLFDEIEKAHKDINNIMLQLLDEGILTDSKGQHIDFTNTLIIYTSNLGCPTSPIQFKSFQNGEELLDEEYKFLSKNVDIAVKKFFKPEFLNRLDSIVVFKPLSILCLINIINKFIYNLNKKLKNNNILLQVELEENMKIFLAKLAYNPLYGARPLKRIIEQFIEKPISELIINFNFKVPHLFSIFINKEKEIISYLIQKINI